MSARDLPYQHLSIRVPWHDTGWDGRVCDDPIGNGSCLRLKQIAKSRDDQVEMRLAGRTWEQLLKEGDDLPPCANERASFMSSHSRPVTKMHPYAAWYPVYSKFGKATYTLPEYAADCIPFRWMLREDAAEIAEHYGLPYRAELEDEVDQEAGTNPIWVQHGDNQTLMLNSFFSSVKRERSLVFFYAQESPLTNDPRRLLIGVGRAESVGGVVPYEQTGGGFGSVIWQRVVKHSIRSTREDGFLLPYHELLKNADNHDGDLSDLAVFVPDEYRLQFSYASEHVSHDAAITLLLSIDRAIERFAPLVSGNWDGPKTWLSDRLAEIWQARGPCPGLGAALKAFGIEKGVFLAYAAQSKLNDNEDPWALIDKWLRDPTCDPEASSCVGEWMSEKWSSLPEERRSLLKLLSRFDLSIEQAIRNYNEREKAREILSNPYHLYEINRLTADPIAVSVIDRGVFLDDKIRSAHPLPEPSVVHEPVDPRRVRALVVDALEHAATAGHSLQSQNSIIQEVRDLPLRPTCPLDADLMAVFEEDLSPVVVTVQMANRQPAYQLGRLNEAKLAISRHVNRRRKGKALAIDEDWRAVIDKILNEQPGEVVWADSEDEEQARQEKAAALKVLATSRISVLVGAAGTGKTTLLKALTSLPGVSEGGLLLLAPTGKARVRMQEAIGHPASTLAQFLLPHRYDLKTGRYHRSRSNRWKSDRTVIVDECSMISEEMLDALFDSIQSVDRLVLVGDPRQLPPIGVGRPFVDIIERIRRENDSMGFPRVAASYAELTIPRRQIASGTDERADLLLAEWFSGDEPSPASDEVWDRLRSQRTLDTVSIRQWNNFNDLHDALREEIAIGSEMVDSADSLGFEQSYGGEVSGDYAYFNLKSAVIAESWQVLSPIRGEGSGVNELNRMLQRAYRSKTLNEARNRRRFQRFPEPGGSQEIIYGDKVINVRNRRNWHYYPKVDNCLEYVANGEIGVVTGPFRRRGRPKPPFNLINVAFSTQPEIAYTYYMSELKGEDSSPILELAYAITIHKSQGSEFNKTFVVIPNRRPLSRELLYTSLTRQRDHVVILHQGDLSFLRELSNPSYSDTAARQTNLFADPEPVEVNGRFLESGLIHRTRSGLAVRSKSEVIIADILYSKDIEFYYEQSLRVVDGSWRLPDFTIEDDTTGTIFYWEHLGMMSRPLYRQKWEQKLAWYREHGILPHEEGGGPSGALIVTRDGDDGSISSADIETLVDELLM